MIPIKSPIIPTWCPGCQDYLLYGAITQAINQLNIPKENIVLVFDIGCVGNMADFFNTYGIHSLHGRCIPTAIGIKIANPKLTVFAIGGDGGIYGEGLNHLLAGARGNFDITVIVANNQLYSLTTGQASPTTPKGSKTKSTPTGVIYQPIDGVPLVNQVNPNCHARKVDSRDPSIMATAIKDAVMAPGFSMLDFPQICVTFGKQISVG